MANKRQMRKGAVPDIHDRNDLSATVTVLLRKIVRQGGRVYIAGYDPENPRIWTQLPILVQGGGPDDFVYTPPIQSIEAEGEAFRTARTATSVPDSKLSIEAEGEAFRSVYARGARQVVVTERENKVPAAIGCVQHPSMELTQKPPVLNDDADEDHTGTVAKQDFAWSRAGVRLIMDGNGAFLIDAIKSAVKTIRIQLAGVGKLRISRNGSATGRLVLWHKIRNFLEDQHFYLGQQEDHLAYLDSQVNALIKLLEGLVIIPEGSIPESWDLAFGDSLKLPEVDAMAAAAVHVSADVES